MSWSLTPGQIFALYYYINSCYYSSDWYMRIVFCWASIRRAVGLLLLHHLNIIWTTCLTSQQLEHIISPKERLTDKILSEIVSHIISVKTHHILMIWRFFKISSVIHKLPWKKIWTLARMTLCDAAFNFTLITPYIIENCNFYFCWKDHLEFIL